tara:strand:+ start:3108 stop:3461 length:354 start_codon:yes stop_codon:yes gene_type:complete
MFVESILVLVGLVLLVAVIFLAHNLSSKALLLHLETLKEDLVDNSTSGSFNLDELKDELLDMVHETIGSMQPPNAFDHLLGALAGPIQMWAMRKAGIDPSTGKPLDLLEQITEPLEI